MLESYYDLNKADRFESLFGHLTIGQTPTAGHNRYLVLKWDFSEVSPVGDGEAIKRNLYSYVNDRISAFSLYYRTTLPASPPNRSPGCAVVFPIPAQRRAAD